MIGSISDLVYVTVRPKSAAPLSPQQLDELARVAHAETAESSPDGSARLGFAAGRYSVQAARGNLEMAARMQLGARWHTRYEIVDA